MPKLSEEPLTIPVVLALAEITNAAGKGAKVARLMPDGQITVGIARSVGDENGCLPPRGTDVRDEFLRVTTLTGMETYWPVAELVTELRDGAVSLHYDR